MDKNRVRENENKCVDKNQRKWWVHYSKWNCYKVKGIDQNRNCGFSLGQRD